MITALSQPSDAAVTAIFEWVAVGAGIAIFAVIMIRVIISIWKDEN